MPINHDIPWISTVPIPDDLAPALLSAIHQRARAKATIDEQIHIIANANTTLEPLLLALGLKSLGISGVGTVTRKPGTNVRLSKDLMQANLLAQGLDAEVVADLITRSTAITMYTSIEFKVW